MEYAQLKEMLEINDLKNLLEKYKNLKQQKKNFNIFSILHLCENNHSELLVWLLNASGKNENSIQYHFLKEFLKNKELKLNEINPNIDDDTFLNDFIRNLKVETQHSFNFDDNGIQRQGNIDIFLHSEKYHYVCIIEVKLDAKVCKDKDGVTQVEKYRKYIDRNYGNCQKNFVFLCVNENRKLTSLLNEFEYALIEHSDIVLMLYRVLNRNKGTLKEDDFVLNLFTQYIEYWELYNEFNGGYSKILDVEVKDGLYEIFAWDVCKRLKDLSPEEYNKLDKDLKLCH